MPQIYVQPEKIINGRFSLDPKESHHVSNVLRKKPGDQIHLFDGKGRKFVGELTGAGQGKILQEMDISSKVCDVVLFQGLPKGSKFDYVIEKATELGADRIVPFLSQKNIIKLDPAAAKKKQARWQRLSEAAAKQCGRSNLPAIDAARPLDNCAEEIGNGLSLYFSLNADTKSLKKILSSHDPASFEKINLIVGPESGFSDKEEKWLVAAGAMPVSLGSLTLRTETAGLAALAVLNYELNNG